MNNIAASGMVSAKVTRGIARASWRWRTRNALRLGFLWGLFCNWLAWRFSALTGIPTLIAELSVAVITHDGAGKPVRVLYGVVSRRVVTSAGVGFIVDDWDSSATDITTLNYHACGTGENSESSGDTSLQTEATTITDRATGTKSQPAANQLRSVGTQTFTGSGTITEHGLFSVVTESSGVLWDRSVFTGIAVGSSDFIEWTYTCTLTAGG